MSFLQLLPISEKILEDFSMGFVEGLPTSKGYKTILVVVVDKLSKGASGILSQQPVLWPRSLW